MITLKYKVKYQTKFDLNIFINQWNSVMRFCFNRYVDGLSTKEIYHKAKILNNINLLDTVWIESAMKRAKVLYDANNTKGNPKVIFGGRGNFEKLKRRQISKDEWKSLRNFPVYSVGRAERKGNKKFKMDFIKNNKIIMMINRTTKIDLSFVVNNKTHLEYLHKLEYLAEDKKCPISYHFDGIYLFICFDEKVITEKSQKIFNRIMSIDQNPNYTGIVISDFDENNNQKIIYREIIKFKKLNLYNKNNKTQKKNFELFELTKHIVKTAKHFQCELIALEKLIMEGKNHLKGRNFNRLICEWNRKDFKFNIRKRCNIFDIGFIEIAPEYSSFIGCINNPKEYDMIAAAIEIGRRANLFNRIYIRKDMEKCDIVFPKMDSENLTTQWKEMLNNDKSIKSWKDFYYACKKLNLNYRYLIKNNEFFRMKSNKSLLENLIIN